MASSALSLQWGLDSTATDTLSVARGLMMAATSDNVSILALLACERFGGTLPASSMSMQKVASALIPRSPAPVAFLKATVGFLHNDCAMQLGTSAAGVRFLVFAAALVPTAGVFQSAVTLDKMLRDSASDLTIVPPQQGLRDLLRVLEPRAPACGFFDTVVFCQRLVEEQIVPKILSTNIPSGISLEEVQNLKHLMLEGVPPADTLAELINAFRQIGRLGLATVATLTIRAGTGIPWVLAFTQWCLDFPISLSVGNFNVLAPANAKVHIIVPEDVTDLQKRIRITTHHQLEKLVTLIQPPIQETIEVPGASHSPANRLVTFGAYRDHLLRRLGLHKWSPELLREAIEYSIPILLSRFPEEREVTYIEGKWPEKHHHYQENKCNRHRIRPFPGVHVVSRVARKLLSINEPLSFKKLNEGQLIEDLSQVSRHFAQVPKIRCHECDWRDGGISLEPWDIGHCSELHFFTSLAMLTCEIFAISMFRDPETTLFQPQIHRSDIFEEMIEDISSLLEHPQGTKGGSFNYYNLVRLAKYLVGYDDSTEEPKDDIMSYHQGQVLYHAILDTFRVEKYGYAELICLPGVLRCGGEVISSVVKGRQMPSIRTPAVKEPTLLQKEDILIPPNFEDTSISWRVSMPSEAKLEAMILWSSKVNKTQKDAYPENLLDSLSRASILETCAHSQDTPVGIIEDNIFDAPVWRPNYDTNSTALHVVRVGRAADQLCFALASIGESRTVVIGKGACFGCCVKLCRALEVQTLLFCTSRA